MFEIEENTGRLRETGGDERAGVHINKHPLKYDRNGPYRPWNTNVEITGMATVTQPSAAPAWERKAAGRLAGLGEEMRRGGIVLFERERPWRGW